MMDSLTLNEHLEVIITKDTDRFKAASPSFPKCKGFGASKEEAITKLSRSIGNHLARKTSKSLEKILHSKAYSEVITNPSSNTPDQHLVFSLYENQPVAKQDVFVKLDELQSFFGSQNSSTSTVATIPSQDILTTGPTMSMDPNPNFGTSSLSEIRSGESLLYGIQFSLN